MTETTKSVHVCIASNSDGRLIIDRQGSTRDTHCEVVGVPLEIAASAVILQLSQLVILPWPKRIEWSAVKDQSSGYLFKPPPEDR